MRGSGGRGPNEIGSLRVQDLLSFVRPVLGAFVLYQLIRAPSSAVVLPLVVIACLTDMWDGRLARRTPEQRPLGRYIDNLCDAAFLAMAFAGFAIAHTWSHPITGRAIQYNVNANWLPLIGLGFGFGTYLFHWGRGTPSSPQGHIAGIANYVLVLLGGFAVIPGVFLSPWILEPAFLTVALLNLSAGADNLGILVRSAMSRR